MKRSKTAAQLRHLKALASQQMAPKAIIMPIQNVADAAVDELGSVVETKTHQRWRWPALDQRTGLVWAYVLGTHPADGF